MMIVESGATHHQAPPPTPDPQANPTPAADRQSKEPAMSAVVLDRDTTIVRPAHPHKALPRRSLLAGAAALLLTAGAAWYGTDWWTTGRFIETTDDAYVGGNVTPIAPHAAGFVTEIAVTDNQLVHAGDLLVRIDPRDYQAALDHARAVVAARIAALASLRAQYTLQQSTIRQAAAELDAKTAQADRKSVV